MGEVVFLFLQVYHTVFPVKSQELFPKTEEKFFQVLEEGGGEVSEIVKNRYFR